MKDFVIMTDSCCDLPKQYIESNSIPYVSLSCSFKGEEYPDDFGKSLDYKSFYDGMRSGVIPKTSQPNANSFYKVYKDIVNQNKDVLYICVSSGLSGTYNSANIAKGMIEDEYPDARVVIVDVLTASLGQGLMVIKAIGMKNNGANLDEIKEYLEDNRMNLNTYITVDDLNHLKRGGRISTTAAFVGTVLHLKPVLTLNDEGKVIAILKIRGRKNVLNKLAELVFEKIENPDEEIIAICHGDVETEAKRLKELILEKVKVKNVIVNHIGPVVGTYGGPGAIAVFFIGKHRQNHIIDIDI